MGTTLRQTMEHTGKLVLRSSHSEDTTPETGLFLGHALAKEYGKVVVGNDLMKSSPMMKNALIAGLISSGADVIDIGTVSGPVAEYAARMGDCCVYVTEFRQQDLVSGYLLIEKDGSFFDIEQVRRLERLYKPGDALPDYKNLGTVKRYYEATRDYNDRVLSVLENINGGIVVLNCNCGMAGDSAPQILNLIGTDVISIHGQKDRNYISNPLSTKEADIRQMRALVDIDAGSIGISLNRIGTLQMVFDEQGEPMTDEQVLAILILFLKPQKVVVPMDMTWMIEDVFRGSSGVEVNSPYPDPDAEKMEFIVCRPSAGTLHKAMAENEADLLYYQGGFAYRDISCGPDAIMTSVLLSQFSSNNNLKKTLEQLPKYYSERKSYKISCSQDEFARILNANIPDVSPMGVFSDFGYWRVDMNSGGFCVEFNKESEDLIDVMAESNDKLYLVSLMEVIDNLMESCESGQ